MPAAANATPDHIKDVNTRYHDVAAGSYDAKWGINFNRIGRRQVSSKLAKALGHEPEHFPDALEIGAGTGYFSLNLIGAGTIGALTATDISPRMLEALRANAERLRLEVATVRSEAETLPFADESFDLVLGHAVLHHIPDLDRAAAEFLRVLRPGGTIAFCGEPSAYGDRLATVPKRAGLLAAPLWRRIVGAEATGPNAGATEEEWIDHGLESEVDVHSFDPAALEGFLGRVGFDQIRIGGEELLANMYGWGLRTVEASAEPASVPDLWRQFAFRSYMALNHIDTAVLEPHLPPSLFYNLVVSARKPPSRQQTQAGPDRGRTGAQPKVKA